jgi:hypothetical protein
MHHNFPNSGGNKQNLASRQPVSNSLGGSKFSWLTYTIVLSLVFSKLALATIIPANRLAQWQGNVGVPGDIPNITTVYKTLTPQNTLAQINAAIASCPPNRVVKLAAGTYNLNGQIYIGGKNNMVLRGSGVSTVLVFSGSPYMGNIYVETPNKAWVPGATNLPFTANWTGGYAQGSTSITLSTTNGIGVGSYIWLDQLDDGNDVGSNRSIEGCSICGRGKGQRSQQQMVKVTGISGNTVTISPPVQMPNWRSPQSPQAFAVGALSGGVGIEDLRIIGTKSKPGAGYGANICFSFAPNSWVRNVSSENEYLGHPYPENAATHVMIYYSGFTTVRHCYFYGTKTASDLSYGILIMASSNNLIEDNILEKIALPVVIGSASGNVVAYNYTKTNFYQAPATYMTQSFWCHDAHSCMNLFEGNYGTGVRADSFHGTSGYNTVFRNRFTGFETLAQTNGNFPIQTDSYNRYWSYAGNVLGTVGLHKYSDSLCTGVYHWEAIWHIGWSTSPRVLADPLTVSTMYRHGNYDTVTRSVAWDPSNADHALPNSYYLSSKPSWFGNLPWPPIDPAKPASAAVTSLPAGNRYLNGGLPTLAISTRGLVQGGDHVLIGGFTIAGIGKKKLILRALGPSLPVKPALSDPSIELRDAKGALIAGNDNWRTSQPNEIISSRIPPANNREAALVIALDPGSYTAIVRGINGATGIGLVEVYDLDPPGSGRKLTSISTRGNVLPGDGVLIGGFTLGNGDRSTAIAARAVGPSLSKRGVSGALTDPVLGLYNAHGALIASNDNWRDSDANAIWLTRLAPLDVRESTIVTRLAPGNYTAIVSGKNGATGIALVEIYNLH